MGETKRGKGVRDKGQYVSFSHDWRTTVTKVQEEVRTYLLMSVCIQKIPENETKKGGHPKILCVKKHRTSK